MATDRACGECGVDLPINAPQGLCPRCLAAMALELGATPSPLTTGVSGTALAPLNERPGERIDRYKLRQQIGEGGCGVVYMAEQVEPVHRRVALKIIKLGMDTEQVIARFEAERQALAMMEHPNIAKVLDAGTTQTGRPYFVMELVRGIKITDYCDQNNVPTKQRLELFSQVCRAIQHAHQKGIIHRDIKPSNILVTVHDGVPMPKVIDFGIAKATQGRLTNQTLFTAFEQFIGTPAYMSPEQAEMSGLDIDTRSDIYALGVLLYELLTGQTPFDAKKLLAAGLDKLRRIIREEEPERPSTRLSTMLAADLTNVAKHRQAEPAKLKRSMRGDLDWIVLKALEKDRTRRYETANGLVMDIQRHLNDEPILARPPSHWYRFQKLVRRNQLAVGAVSAVTMALVVGLAVSTLMFFQERTTRQRAMLADQEERSLKEAANAAGQKEVSLREEAEDNEQKAQSEAIKSEQVSQFLKRMLGSVGPSVALGRDTTMLREILDKTSERLGNGLTNQPDVETELRATIGQVYFDLFELDRAERMFRKVLELQKLHGDVDAKMARTLQILAEVLVNRAKFSEARALLEQALIINRKVLGTEQIAKCLGVLAVVALNQGNLSEAEASARQALAMQRKLLGDENADVAKTLGYLAAALSAEGKGDEAEAEARASLVMTRKVWGPGHPEEAMALEFLSDVLLNKGKTAEAESTLREALARNESLLGMQHLHSGELIWRVAMMLRDEERAAEAESLLRGQVTKARSIFENNPEKMTVSVMVLNDFLLKQGKFEDSDKLLNEVLTTAQLSRPGSSGLLAVRANQRGRTGRWSEAIADFSRLIEMEPTNHVNYHALAALLVQNGDREGYQRLCKRIRERFGDITDDSNLAIGLAKDCFILPGLGTDTTTEARLADLGIQLSKSDRYEGNAQFCKGLAEYRQGKFARVGDWVHKSLVGTNSWDRIRHVEACMVMAMAQFQLGKPVEARKSLANGLEIEREKLPKLENGDISRYWIDWIIAHALMREAQSLIDGDPKPVEEMKPASAPGIRLGSP